MRTTLGGEVLASLIRRQAANNGRLDGELVLVRAHPVLVDLPADLDASGRRWRVVVAHGELTLRKALLARGTTVAVIPLEFDPPADLAQRSWMRRPLQVTAQDVVAAAAGRPSAPIVDERLAARVLDDPADFAARAARWSFRDPVVGERDVRQILLGLSRPIERRRPSDLLADWIVGGPPAEGREPLAGALRAAHRKMGGLLAAALSEDGLASIVRAGSLAGVERVLEADAPGNTDTGALRNLVEPAVRLAWAQDQARVLELLRSAEERAAGATLSVEEARQLPLLRVGFEVQVSALVRRCAKGETPDQDELDALTRNLRASDAQIQFVADLVELRRFSDSVFETPSEPADWCAFHRRHSAWADLAARRARHCLADVPRAVADDAYLVLDAYLEARDGMNAAFAATLAEHEAASYGRSALREGLSVHLLSRALLAPLVNDGRKVFLLVLDGCDLSTFYEVLGALPDTVGLAMPSVSGRLRTELQAAGAVFGALSPVPTVTSVGRRAIFGGEVPKNPALNAHEAAGANSSADTRAFRRNAALDGIDRQLFLKGDLGADAAAVRAALDTSDGPLIAAVFNVVDDALSSKELTPLGPWSGSLLGRGLLDTVEVAAARGWTIVATSDHGHTPFWSDARKVSAPRGAGQRFSPEPREGSVEFGAGALREDPIHALTGVGRYVGGQHRGYHGGASLEEVVVPVALLGAASPGQGRLHEPAWASLVDDLDPEPVAAPTATGDGWLAEVAEPLRVVVQHLDQHRTISEADVAEMAGRRGFRRLVSELTRLDKANKLPWKYERTNTDGMARLRVDAR